MAPAVGPAVDRWKSMKRLGCMFVSRIDRIGGNRWVGSYCCIGIFLFR